MRKHPILFGLLILLVLGIFSYLYFYKLGLSSGKSRSFSFKNKVGVVTIEGVVSDSMETVDQINEFGEDDSIVAVVLRIDSPGGGVAASQEIYEAVKELRKKKKVVTSMGSIAASGGLLIACAADKIVANPGTITGSISAIMHFANLEDLLKKIGIKASVIKSGEYKDIGSPLREMTDQEKMIIQDLVDDIYNQFVDVIVKDRNLPREKVLEIADGRVFSGRKAKELGLVDDVGDMSFAVKTALKLAGREGKYDLVYPRKKHPSFLDFFLQSAADHISTAIQGEMKNINGLSYLYYPVK
ncbi:MAG TPA: signal peptide peptidase SppA [Smithella sp.]|nr:signal peptide peptidase SppA [Smithella sp.]